MLETDLVSYLSGQSSITSLVGTNIQPLPAPENLAEYPCITFQVASYLPGYSTTGMTGWAQKRIVYNCWATAYLQAHTILEALRTVLTGYQGTLPNGTKVFFIECANGEDYFESESRLYRATLHTLVQYSE